MDFVPEFGGLLQELGPSNLHMDKNTKVLSFNTAQTPNCILVSVQVLRALKSHFLFVPVQVWCRVLCIGIVMLFHYFEIVFRNILYCVFLLLMQFFEGSHAFSYKGFTTCIMELILFKPDPGFGLLLVFFPFDL